jgi:hypothetical protein
MALMLHCEAPAAGPAANLALIRRNSLTINYLSYAFFA